MELIADNLRITKTDIQEALKDLDPKPIQGLVKQCVAKGAWAIDLNTGPLGKQPEAGMQFFIRAVQRVTDLPLLIDTSNPAAMRAGLEVADNRIIIDPVVPPLVWADGIVQARAVLNVIRMLPDLLGFNVRTIAGISNLTTGAGHNDKKNQRTNNR
ncbi:hypothetical protein [Desulfobacula sp.]|uniref:hypothetical protein n=1 Tax=Desulfobacula sp. TaxID=2593537 RepID=UPI00262D09ED|nr:hypothetical protein [Desulfobacula sp.]